MQSVGIPSSLHDPAGLLVHDHYLVFHDDVLHIFFEKGIGFQKLGHGVDSLAFYREILKERLFLFGLFLDLQIFRLDGCDLAADIRHNKEVLLLIPRYVLDSFIGKFDRVLFLLDHKE